MNDIINLSVEKIYQSREVIEKEIVGYQIIQTLLDKFITAFNNKYEGTASNYDKLLLKMLPEKHHLEKTNLYERLLAYLPLCFSINRWKCIRIIRND